MKHWMTGMLLAAVALGSFGCVAQNELDEMQTLYRKSQEQVIELQAQLEEANARIAALQAAAGDDADLQPQLERALAERDRLRAALEEAEQRLRSAQVGPELPPELDAALRDLAEQYPDLMTYDPDLGMVKFQSDLTFALGSAEVRPEAQQTLSRLAEILRSASAQAYEIRIVGHTDNVPIGNPATRAKHPTNWHLSAHRAIAVKDVLEDAGVAPVRMQVAGYSQYRPIVPNGPRGAEANRRVELYLVPMTAADFAAAGRVENPAPAAPAPAAERAEPAEVDDAPPAMFK